MYFYLTIVTALGILAQEGICLQVKSNRLTPSHKTDHLSVNSINERLQQLETKLENQSVINDHNEQIIRMQNDRIQKLEEKIEECKQKYDVPPEGQYNGAAYGCTGSVISMSCPTGQILSILHADYGEYSDVVNCAEDQCCGPHPKDCTEAVVDNNVAEWIALKLECENRTSCDYLFQASTFIERCTVSEVVDYMSIYYTCIPEDPNPIVAFTAYSERTREFTSGQVVLFEKTVTNLGSYYHPNSSVFICPRFGLYQFSIYILANINCTVQANIVMDGQQIVIAWADSVPNTYTHSSNSVFAECQTGQKVWVESSSINIPGVVFNNGWKHSTFSGLLLHIY